MQVARFIANRPGHDVVEPLAHRRSFVLAADAGASLDHVLALHPLSDKGQQNDGVDRIDLNRPFCRFDGAMLNSAENIRVDFSRLDEHHISRSLELGHARGDRRCRTTPIYLERPERGIHLGNVRERIDVLVSVTDGHRRRRRVHVQDRHLLLLAQADMNRALEPPHQLNEA
ncbi:hypothetical protein D3C71_1574330 [compost metagenome]